MAFEVKIPSLGESIKAGTLAAWLVSEGQQVSEGQPLY